MFEYGVSEYSPNIAFIVNENGIALKLPMNPYVTCNGQRLYGNVVVVGQDDYDDTPMTIADLRARQDITKSTA